MPDVIYRKSDRLVAGYCYPPQSLELEIQNVCDSELGGTPGQYGTVWIEGIQPGMDLVITEDHRVDFVPNPTMAEHIKSRASGMVKLKALGLTDSELRALLAG